MTSVLRSAGGLRYSLDLGGRPSSLARVLQLGQFEVELRLAGTAHQAIVRGPGPELCETVGFVGGAGSPVPEWMERLEDDRRYVFRSCVQRPGVADLRARAAVLQALAEEDPDSILAVGADEADALTAVACRPLPGGVAWTAWHLHPRAGEMLVTRSRVVGA